MNANTPMRVLDRLQAECLLTPRKNRLIATQAARVVVLDAAATAPGGEHAYARLFDLMPKRQQVIVLAAERFALGEVGREALDRAGRDASINVALHRRHLELCHRRGEGREVVTRALMQIRSSQVAMATALRGAPLAARETLRLVTQYSRSAWTAVEDETPAAGRPAAVAAAHMGRLSVARRLRDVIEDVAAPTAGVAVRRRARDGHLAGLAEAAAAEGHCDELVSILADAIEDLVDDADLAKPLAISACRSGRRHFEGFWVTDWLRGVS